MFITTSSDMEWEEIAGKLASHDSTKSIDKGKYNRIQITQKKLRFSKINTVIKTNTTTEDSSVALKV